MAGIEVNRQAVYLCTFQRQYLAFLENVLPKNLNVLLFSWKML
jgi:hypothetical protein